MGKTVAEIIRTQDYVYWSVLVRPHSEVLDFTAVLNMLLAKYLVDTWNSTIIVWENLAWKYFHWWCDTKCFYQWANRKCKLVIINLVIDWGQLGCSLFSVRVVFGCFVMDDQL